MKNWKTTVAGYVAALLTAWANGGLDFTNPKTLLASAGIVALGHLAADAKP
jgi:hypothetical protein